MKLHRFLPITAFLAIAAFAPAIFETQQAASEQVDQAIQTVAIRSDTTPNGAITRRKNGLDVLRLASQQWPANNDTLRRSNSPPLQIVRTPHKLKRQQNR